MRRRDAIPFNELALAYELHLAGCSWKIIAWGLGRNALSLADSVGDLVRGDRRYTPER